MGRDDGEIDPSLDEAIAEARPDDPAAIALARARIERSLFGDLAPGFGRFRVLERLGAGGMGVVYSAYDPQLDRGVALKMIEIGAGDRDTALAEAKALAKLSHPNVVPIFDVGVEGGRVYLVMELVRGTSLGAWCKERTDAEIVDAYRQVGAGLAAAHDAGLIHRDMKPDNVLVGDDGRVRVVDFGLACEAAGVAGRGAGTPRYMAPEQKESHALTPAVDQYSFCVSLAEALGDSAPRWISTIVERGLSTDPTARYPSMHELVRQLGRDPARVLRRRLAIAGGVAALVAVFVLVWSRSEAVEICGGGDTEIAAVWPPGQQAMALGRASAFGSYGREIATKLPAQLASHASAWAAAHRQACLDHRRGVQSDEMFDRRMICLERGRVARSELGRIATTAMPDALPGVAVAAASLPDPRACADRELLATSVSVPPAQVATQVATLRTEIERSRVMVAAGEFTRARETLRETITKARAIAYSPILAEALLVDGQAAMSTDDPTLAIEPLREATTLAFRAGALALAIEAWARRVFVEGNFVTTNAPVPGGIEVVDAIAASVPTAHFARALLANNLGTLAWLAGRHDEMRARHAAAQREAAYVTGEGAIELLVVHSNALLAADDPALLDGKQREVIAKLSDALGAGHPLTLWNRFLRATVSTSGSDAALVELVPACEGMESHTSLPQRSADCWAEVAELRDAVGDVPGALAAAERALRHGTPGTYPQVVGYLAWWRGDGDRALQLLDAAASAAPGDTDWYSELTRLKIDLARRRVLFAMGRRDEARASLATTATRLRALPVRATTIVRRYITQADALMEST